MKAISKKWFIVSCIIIVMILMVSSVACFLAIPRKTNQPLLPVTIEGSGKYNCYISNSNVSHVFSREGLLLYLDNNLKNGGTDDNDFAKKYGTLYKTKGLYVELTGEECMELFSSGGSYENAMEIWRNNSGLHFTLDVRPDGNIVFTGESSLKTIDEIKNYRKFNSNL